MRGWTLGLALVVAVSPASAQSKTYKGIEIAVTRVERASSASLGDCPPGANTQRGMARAGEEFAIVTISLKVGPSYSPTPLKRPVLSDGAGKKYNTAASFVDPGKLPESSCQFPFRVPIGTKLKSLQIENMSFELPAADSTSFDGRHGPPIAARSSTSALSKLSSRTSPSRGYSI